MSDYQSIPEINDLFNEQENVQVALDLLDDNGTITSFRVDKTEASFNQDASPVNVATIDPADELLIAARAQLIARFNEINLELNALGVVNLPPDKTMLRAVPYPPDGAQPMSAEQGETQ